MFRILLTCFYLLLSTWVYAQWRGLRLSSLGPKEGLTMRVNAIAQDSSGYLYFGGTQGMVRYDGNTLKPYVNIYNDTTSISPGEVYQMISSRDGHIYLGIRFSGFNRFDPRLNTFKRFTFPELDEEMEYGAESLIEDDQGTIWVGGQRLRLYRLDQNADTLEVFYPEWFDFKKWTRRLTIKSIIQDINDPDIFWLSVLDYRDPQTADGSYPYGLFTFNRETHEFKSHHNIGKIDYQTRDGILRSTHVLRNIITYDPGNKTTETIDITIKFSDIQYLSRALLPRGENEWILTAGEIREWDRDGHAKRIYLSPDVSKMTDFHVDQSGRTWITSWQGVRSIDPEKNQIEFYSLSDLGDEERIYPGRLAYHQGTNSILLAHNGTVGKNRLYRIPLDKSQPADFLKTDKNIMGIAVDPQDNIWLSDNNEIRQLIDDEISNAENVDRGANPIWWHWNMRMNKNGVAGILGTNRLMWFDTKGGQLNKFLLNDFLKQRNEENLRDQLNGFAFDNKGHAVIFNSRLYHIQLPEGIGTELKYDASFNPSWDFIFDVRIDHDDFYWISGPSSTGRFKRENDSLILVKAYTVQDGLAESQVTEMHIDYQNRIWCFTSSGINCIDQHTNEIRYFGLNEGVPQIFIDPRQVITLPDHRIATVNQNGLIVFHPDSLWNIHNTQLVPVVINDIRVNGEIAVTSNTPNYLTDFTLPSGKNVVDIQFRGLKFPSARQLNYSYRLVGYLDEWIDIGTNNSVTLSGLPSGNFDLEIKAGGLLGNAPIKKLRLHIPTPIQKQLWFILLSLGLIGLGIYLMYRQRINKVREEEAKKTSINKKMAELEMKALRAQMNPHFMFNSLNSIKNFILQSEKKEAAEYLSNFAHLIRMILQNSREKTISLHEELETLMLYIELEQLRFDDAFEFNCEIDPGVSMETTFIPPMILQPYIENAIWHGLMHKKGNGILSLIFKIDKSHIYCIVQDNGVGREKALEIKNKSIRKYKSMGMGITHDRIELANNLDLLGIEVSVEDLQADIDGTTGTKVIVKIPIKTEI